MMLFATVACLALTGYIAWHRVPDSLAARKIEQTVQSPMSERRLVPYLIGATKEEATKLLKREGFEVGTVSVVAVPNREQRGKVDSQHPMQGSSAKPGSSVDLLIAE
jgi:beta-lactam-binding protein with PASTA domain